MCIMNTEIKSYNIYNKYRKWQVVDIHSQLNKVQH